MAQKSEVSGSGGRLQFGSRNLAAEPVLIRHQNSRPSGPNVENNKQPPLKKHNNQYKTTLTQNRKFAIIPNSYQRQRRPAE